MRETVGLGETASEQQDTRPREWIANVAEAIPLPAAAVNSQGQVLYANAWLRRTLGTGSAQDSAPCSLEGWLVEPREAGSAIRQLLDTGVRNDGRPPSVAVEVRAADGSTLGAKAYARTLGDASDPSAPVLITFRLDAEVALLHDRLADCESRYQSLLETSTDQVFAVDMSGRLLFVNGAWEQRLGYAANEVVDVSGLDLVEPESRDTCRRALERAATGQSVENLEFRARTRGGESLDFLVNLSPLRNAQGQVTHVLGAARDISDLKRAQEELRSSEQRLRILFEYAPDAYYLNDLKGNFLDGNRAAERLCGYRRDELIGKNFLQLSLLPSNQIPRAAGLLAKNALGRPTGPTEFCLTRKDGSQAQIEVRTHPVQLGGETVTLGIARDVTERRAAEDKLKESERRYRSIFDSAGDALCVIDLDGRIVEVNPQLCSLHGYAPQEVLGRNATEFIHPDSHALFERFVRQVARGRRFLEEATTLHKDGAAIDVEVTGTQFAVEGKQCLLAILRDIRDRKAAEAELEALNYNLERTIQDMERSNHELREFAHVAAHDLKAPLRGIATLADWIEHDYAPCIDEQGRQSLALMQERVTRMTHLIDGILRYAEIGHGEPAFEPVDMQTLVTEVIEQVAPPAHVSVSVEGVLPSLPCDRVRLTQVFLNLISNAVKCSDKPTGEIRITAVEGPDAWEFRVADNGPGIEARHFDRIFQMFQTLSSGDRCESTGLGLAVVKKIVEMHGGSVWVESKVGSGSTFFFTLPKQVESGAREER